MDGFFLNDFFYPFCPTKKRSWKDIWKYRHIDSPMIICHDFWVSCCTQDRSTGPHGPPIMLQLLWTKSTYPDVRKPWLVGGFNPSEKYSSSWIISPSRDENKKYLKPPPSWTLKRAWEQTTQSPPKLRSRWRCCHVVARHLFEVHLLRESQNSPLELHVLHVPVTIFQVPLEKPSNSPNFHVFWNQRSVWLLVFVAWTRWVSLVEKSRIWPLLLPLAARILDSDPWVSASWGWSPFRSVQKFWEKPTPQLHLEDLENQGMNFWCIFRKFWWQSFDLSMLYKYFRIWNVVSLKYINHKYINIINK